ncbi:aldo/keto reductase [Halocatena halophila]|uniref:aldo/keto reductase n=1 Tax=Halocatena halophila TaxID=2814576 RepID=UPI002ED35AD5
MSELPQIGLGTWQNTDPADCRSSVETALELGYRHVDTAHFYENEQHVGEGLAKADVPRDELTIGTKVHAERFGLTYEAIIEGTEASLERLGVEYIDLLYVHWPVGDYDPAETMAAFDELRDRGVIREICLSNFSVGLLDDARAQLNAELFAHQVEMHPLLDQSTLLEYAQEHDHYLVAYSPLARGAVFEIPELQAIASAHDVSEAQVSLAWLLSKANVRVIPKASSKSHLRDNLNALDLELTDAEIEQINSIERTERFITRDGAPWE